MEALIGVDLPTFIRTIGLIGIFGIIFAESGILLGFFLPGDSLLFTAGFLASQGYLDIALLILVSFIGAVSGDSVGYAFGKKVGPAIFQKENARLFNRRNLERSHRFYERHGGKTIIIARFLPIVRTFAPILAGVGRMRYSIFLSYNIFGGALWTASLSLLGFYLGRAIPDVDNYLLPIVAVIILFSLLPTLFHIFRRRRRKSYV